MFCTPLAERNIPIGEPKENSAFGWKFNCGYLTDGCPVPDVPNR